MTKVTIKQVAWHKSPSAREAILKDAIRHRKEAANRSAAAKGRTAQGKRPSGESAILETLNYLIRTDPTLKRRSANYLAPHVQRHWRGDSKPLSVHRIRKHLAKIVGRLN